MPRPFRLKPVIPLEKDVQASILQMLQWHPKVACAWRNNTGAHKMEAPNGKSRFVRYGQPGHADILGYTHTGKFIAIEVKRPGQEARATAAQVEFIQGVLNVGGIAGIVSSVDTAKALVDAA